MRAQVERVHGSEVSYALFAIYIVSRDVVLPILDCSVPLTNPMKIQ